MNELLDKINEYLSERRGLLPMIGIILIALNFIVQFIPGPGWLISSNILLHIGLITAIVGILLIRPLQ